MKRSILPIVVFVVLGLLGAGFAGNEVGRAYAQVTTSITPTTGAGNLGTQVLPPSGNVYGITGGKPVGNNLYHGFTQFNVGTGDIAQFQTPALIPDAAMLNILGRITDTNPSAIFGTIDSATYYSGASLFLMNPYGFLFGPNATVNVGGMMTFTSADYLRLADNTRFNAISNAAADALISASPVVAFGFLGSNPSAITVQGSRFTVSEGQGISLVGGDIEVTTGTLADGTTVRPARLAAPGGQINLASVTSPGEVLATSFLPEAGMTRGTITLSQGSTLAVSSDAAGTVKIRGGQFVIDNATISADSIDTNGAAVAIDVQVTENVSISTVDIPALTAKSTGTGNAGEIKISSGSMDVTSTTGESFFFSAIDTHTSGPGNAGNVTIKTGNLTVTGDPFTGATLFIDSGTSGPAPGRGGDVSITAETIDLQNTLISTGNLIAFFMDEGGAGTAGNVTITADRLQMTLSQIVTDSNDFIHPTGTSGDITITARDLNFDASGLSTTGNERSGAITITADQFIATESQIQAITNLTPGGDVKITGNVIEFRNGSNIASSTMGDGDAGPIIITATNHLGFLDSSPGGRPSGIFNNSFGENGSLGKAGDVVITTPSLQLTGGARINTTTATSGAGGNVTITANNSISMSGENSGFEVEPLFNLGTIQSSGIYTRTIGGNCIGSCGNAGDITIQTGSMSLGSGSQINSGTTSNGRGGNISITASDTIGISGTLSTGQPGGILSRTIGSEPDAGSGGNISLIAGQSVTISDGASVSASSTGPGNTGNIQIDAGNQFAMTNSSVTTQANLASGGTIKITTTPSGTVQLTNSLISASVLDGTGGGGSVNIDPQFVILQNSQILAQAVQGPGGNIFITTNLLLPDANSVISASSQFGVNGTVTIQSPNAPASGKIQPLGKTPLQATSLLNQRCASLAGGEFSSFTVAGRDSLPIEPGSWLASPLYAAGVGEGQGVRGKGLEGAAPILSLRQIAPAGFLTQTFALDWSAGCTS